MQKFNFKLSNNQLIEVTVEKHQVAELKSLNCEHESHERKFKRRTLKETSLNSLKDKYDYDIEDGEIGLDEMLIKKEEIRSLKQAITKLSPKQQRLIQLYFYKNRSLREIAKILNVHPSNVKRQIDTIKKQLKKFL